MIAGRLTCFALAFGVLACADANNEQDAVADTAAVITPAGPAASDAVSADGMLDPNSATAEQLAGIPGLNAGLVTALVNGRPYQDMRGVDAVLSSLSEQQRDSVYTRLWKPLDLNGASTEEIELIPGVGPRMSHEFEEYRPYTSLDQFRREIGKYADQAEVARLERYVTIGNAQ